MSQGPTMILARITRASLYREVKFRVKRLLLFPYRSKHEALPIVVGLVIGVSVTLLIFL